MPLSAILSEADITGVTATNPDQILFNDGFTIGVVPTATYSTTDNNNVDINVTFRNLVDFGFNNMNLNEYISINNVFVQRPVLMEDEQTDFTDRVGLFSFPAVPLGFGSLDNVNSLLRVNSQKLGYYASPVVNVEKFTQDDTSTVSREDVQRVDMSLDIKPKFDVRVNVNDQNGNALNSALVTLDGIYVSSDEFLSEFESTSTLEGSSVSFENVIGGRNSNRILKVIVPNDDTNNYIPKIQTIRNLNGDLNITVEVVNTTDVADSTAVISVLEKEINLVRGTGTIKAKIFDKEDGTLTDSAQIIVYLNNQIVNTPIQREGDIVSISLPLAIGVNSVILEVLNTAGSATSSNIVFDYNPTIGSINGKILGFTDDDSNNLVDSGSLLFMDIFDDQSNYINSLTLPDNGEYVLQDLEANENLKLQVMELNTTNGTLVKKSQLTSVTVPSAAMVRVDMALTEVDQSAAVSGAPIFDFTRDVRVADVNETTGIMKVSMTLSNYNKDVSGATVGMNVNGILQAISQSSITSTGTDYSYAISNYEIQLRPGRNIIYGYAQNPSGEFDYTRDQFIDWDASAEASLSTVTIQVNGCDLNTSDNSLNNCVSLTGITNIELYDSHSNFIGQMSTDNSGSAEFIDLVSGEYRVFAQSTNGDYRYLEMPVSISSGNNAIDVNLTRESEVIDLPEYEIMSMDINSSFFQSETDYTAIVNLAISDADLTGYEFNWSLRQYNSSTYEYDLTPLTTCNSKECEFSVVSTGWVSINVDVNKSGVERNYSQEMYMQELIPETPPTPGVDGIPTPPETTN
jgi:hypothetical protein